MALQINLQGDKSFPPEARGWNWGAFLLTWIWGVCNNTFIALLCLIPAVSFIMMFVLGAKGNEWAWCNKNWESVEQFDQSQRRWALGGVLLWLAFICLFVVVPFGLLGWGVEAELPQIKAMITDFEPQRKFCNYALQSAEREPRLRERLGAPLMLRGRPETIMSKSGYLETALPVRGPRGEGTIYVRSHRLKNEELSLERAEVELQNLERVPISTPTEQNEIKQVEGQIVRLESAIRTQKEWTHREPAGKDEGDEFYRDILPKVERNAEIQQIFGERIEAKLEHAKVKMEGAAGEAEFVVNMVGNGQEGIATIRGARSMGRWGFVGGQVNLHGRIIEIPATYN